MHTLVCVPGVFTPTLVTIRHILVLWSRNTSKALSLCPCFLNMLHFSVACPHGATLPGHTISVMLCPGERERERERERVYTFLAAMSMVLGPGCLALSGCVLYVNHLTQMNGIHC